MDRVLTTHVGSLIRPKELRDLLAARDRGEEVAQGLRPDETADVRGQDAVHQASFPVTARAPGRGPLDSLRLALSWRLR